MLQQNARVKRNVRYIVDIACYEHCLLQTITLVTAAVNCVEVLCFIFFDI